MSKHHFKAIDLQSSAKTVADNFGSEIEGFWATTKSNGGCMDAGFTLLANANWRKSPPTWLKRMYRIDIADARGVWWRGWIDNIGLNFAGKDVRWNVHLMGLGALADDQPYAAKDLSGTVTSTAMSSVITDLVNDAANITKTITASGFTLDAGAAINFSGKASAALNFLSTIGSSGDVVYQWGFYPSDNGSVLFTAAPRSSTVQYRLYLKTLSGWRFKSWGAGYFNRVRVWYNGDALSVDVNDSAGTEQSAEPLGIGRIRTLEVHFPELIHLNDATQVGQVLVAITSQTRMIPDAPFKLLPNSQLQDEYNSIVPLHRIRAGNLVSITDLPSATRSQNTIDFLNSFYIKQTKYTEQGQYGEEMEITPESMDNALQPYIAGAYNLLGGRHRL